MFFLARALISIFLSLSCPIAVAEAVCVREGVPHWAVQDQDGDVFSLMQANSARHVLQSEGVPVITKRDMSTHVQSSPRHRSPAPSVRTKPMKAASVSASTQRAALPSDPQSKTHITIILVALVISAIAFVGLYARAGAHAHRFIFPGKRADSKSLQVSMPVKEFSKTKSGFPSEKTLRPTAAQSRASDAANVSYDPADAPQPLCPTLVLPVSESRFAVLLRDLEEAGTHGELKVYGISGKPLLLIKVKNGTSLEVSLATSSIMPRCTIRVPVEPGSPFDIRGAKGVPYGSFHCSSKGVNEVLVQDRTILTIEGDSSSLQFSITTPSGAPVASAKKNSEDYGDGEHLEIRAVPGADSVLVMGVVMAIAIFKSSDQPHSVI